MERVPEAREMLGDVNFHEARRRLDLLLLFRIPKSGLFPFYGEETDAF
jgi:hypothetical protein